MYSESGTEILNPVFNKEITVTIKYKDDNDDGYEDTTGIPVANLKMYYVSSVVIPAVSQSLSRRGEHARPLTIASDISWIRSSKINKSSKTISATVNHFTVFFLGGFIDTENLVYQNYPNPFCPIRNGHTRIEYSLYDVTGIQLSRVSIRIYNVAGELVRTLLDDINIPAGTKTFVDWDGKNDSGELVSDGVYLCQLTTPDYKKTIKIILIK
jgi:hypothetical protein